MTRFPRPPARLLRYRFTHFAILGAALYLATAPWRTDDDAHRPPADRARVVVTAADVRRLARDFEQRWGMPPNDEQRRALVGQLVDDEILYRQARALALDVSDGSIRRRLLEQARAVGLDRGRGDDELLEEVRALGLHEDVVVRRILAQKMRLVLEREPPPGWDDDTALQAYLGRHPERWMQPGSVSFTHIFLSSDRRGPRAASDAHAILRELSGSPTAASAWPRADPFPLGRRISGYTREKLVARFGESFARSVLTLERGQWSPPLTSPYGVHLVWVEERLPERLPPLDAIREPVRAAVRAEHAARARAQGMAQLRALYEVRIEGESPRPSSCSEPSGDRSLSSEYAAPCQTSS